MTEEYLYHYKMTRKKRSALFIRMSIVCLGYIAAIYLVEYYSDIDIPENTRNISVIAFSLSAIILLYIAFWLVRNPATYEAYVTSDEFSVSYPEAKLLSFRVKIEDIERIEQRRSHSSGGKSSVTTGVLMKNSDFHEISMNYGNSVNKMFKVLESINPEITFPKTVKTDYYLFGKKFR